MSFVSLSPGVTGLDSKYRFKTLPVEEIDANNDVYVCRFDNPTAGASETGAGGGLSGADLVFTQVGGVPGASAGFRQLTKDTNMAFNATLGFFNAFLQAPAGWSALWMLKDIDVSVLSGNRNYLQAMRGGNAFNYLILSMFSANRRSLGVAMRSESASDAVGTSLANSDMLSSNPSDTNFQLLVSSDHATKTAFAGIAIGTLQPKSFADFLYFSLTRGDTAFSGATAMTSFDHSGTMCSVIGSSDPNWTIAGVKIASVTFAKYPAIVPV